MALTSSGLLGLFFHARALTTGVTVTASTEASGFLAGNVLDWENPRLPWRSTTKTADQWLRFDLGASPPGYVGLFVRGANFPSATLQANATDSWGTPAISLPITVATNTVVERRHGLFFFNTGRTAPGHRYVRLLIGANQATDGGGTYYAVESALFAVAAVELTARRPLEQTLIDPVEEQAWPGRREVAQLGARQVRLDLPWEFFLNYAEGATENEEGAMLALSTSPAQPVIVCPNLHRPQEAYVMRRLGEVRWAMQGGVGAAMPLVFEEVG